MHRIPKIITKLTKAFIIATRRFFTEKYTFYVSALTYTTLLSIVPFLSISVFLLTLFPAFSQYIILSENYMFQNFVPDAADSIRVYFENFIQHALHLPIFSIILLFFTTIFIISSIDDTINDIWNITIRRRKIIVLLIYAFILLLAPILIGLSIFVTSYVFSFYFFTPITSVLFFLLPILINTVIFSLFYIYGPNIYVSRSNGILIGFIIAVLIEGARTIFAIWISYFSFYQLIYGVFAILPIFLLWLYICWAIIIWGALVTHALDTDIAAKDCS